MPKYFNRGISMPVVTGIITILIVMVGGVFAWQYFMKTLPKIETYNWMIDGKIISFQYPANWIVEKEYYSTPAEQLSGVSTNIGLFIYPANDKQNNIHIDGRQNSCDTSENHTKCISKNGHIIFSDSKNQEILSEFDRIVSTIKFNEEVLYYIKFQYDKPIAFNSDNDRLTEYINSILETPITSDIFFNFSEANKPVFDRGYYITLNGVLDTNKIYKKNGLSIVIKKTDSKILNYIKNPFYCENDNDCSIRMRDCANGSFNQFNEYHDVYGCEYPMFPQENSEELNKLCDRTKEYAMVEYSGGSKCTNNQCSAVNKKIFCREGVLP